MFMKPINQVTFDDIDELISKLRFKESDRIEYKKTLPDNGTDIDPWLRGEDKIGNKAIEKLTAEVVAFANTHGGTVILGIEENNEIPARPKCINPLPRCHELEQRLIESITDCIEPSLNSIQSHAIEAGDEGNGLILLHIDRSDSAPHRSKKDRQCYIRVQDRTRKMTMEEIQVLAVKSSRQKVEGLWVAKFGSSEHYLNGGTVVIEKGKLYGGDGNYMYSGILEVVEENKIVSHILVEHYHGSVSTAFGTQERKFSVSMFGEIKDKIISGILYRNTPPQNQIGILLEKKKDLL